MEIKLSDHFSYARIFHFVTPSIAMMVFTSIYGIVDGIFVSNFVGKTAFAAINLIMPFLNVLATIGYMFGTGGSATVGKTLGENKPRLANRYFSMLVYVGFASGVVISILGFIFLRPIAVLLGAEGLILKYGLLYGNICMVSMTFYILQSMFQSLFITAEKPKLGFRVMIIAGVANIVFDYLFIVIFQWGIAGAAIATAISEIIGGSAPIIYFLKENSSELQLTKTKIYRKILLHTCVNGSSEMAASLSGSFVSMVFNFQLMKYAGADGVASYGVIMYANWILISIVFGYTMGVSPIISYHYGAKNYDELKNINKKSIIVMTVGGAAITAFALLVSVPLCNLFVGYDADLYEMTLHGYIVIAFSFIFCGFNVYGSDLFTALNNGIISAIISVVRSFFFKTAAVLLLPLVMQLEGIWYSAIVAEVMATIVTMIFIYRKRRKYHYF